VILWLAEPEGCPRDLVGGKAANLAKMISAGFPVPEGFCITTAAYRQVLADGGEGRLTAPLPDWLETGIVTALALGLAGAPRALIVQDYLRSAYSLPRVIERFRSLRLPEELFRCTESTINALLDSVEDDFAGWARVRGVSDAAVRTLRTRLLESADLRQTR